jgi:hypothetical protein
MKYRSVQEVTADTEWCAKLCRAIQGVRTLPGIATSERCRDFPIAVIRPLPDRSFAWSNQDLFGPKMSNQGSRQGWTSAHAET